MDEIAGVGRVLILDNYTPAGPGGTPAAASNVPGAFTVAVCAPDGSNVPSGVKTDVLNLLEADRILDVDVYVIDPTRTNVTVAYTAVTFADWDPAAVKTAADAAVAEYLSPALWGTGDTTGGLPTWLEDLTVRFGELYAVLNNVQGINHVTDVKINGSSNTNATLTGPAALPNLTAVTGTVTAP